MATYCAREGCVAHTEDRGGRKIFNKADSQWYCEDCLPVQVVMNDGKNLWDFHTSHPYADGRKVYVGSLANMRRIERESGTSNQAANDYTRNW